MSAAVLVFVAKTDVFLVIVLVEPLDCLLNVHKFQEFAPPEATEVLVSALQHPA